MTSRLPCYRPAQLVVSVEHASNRVPKALDGLGLSPRWLQSHHGWDPGAATVARAVARAFDAPLHLGRWSRLVADLNRSADHRRVVPPALNGRGPRIRANQLDRPGREARLERYWRPYREAVEQDLDRATEQHGLALHLSVHSFVERFGGEERRNHFGLLYHPRHRAERAMADRLDGHLSEAGYRVRRNYPYSGLDDGFCMRMRAERDWSGYLGMEIELNQRMARRDAGAARMAELLIEALRAEFAPR